MNEEISTDILNPKYFLFMTIYVLSSTVIALFTIIYLHLLFLGGGVLIISWFLPVLNPKPFKKIFLQNARICFYDDQITIILTNKRTGSEIKTDVYQYDGLKTVIVSHNEKSGLGLIRIDKLNGDKTSYNISEWTFDENNVQNIMRRHINDYNNRKEDNKKIKFRIA